MASRAFAAGALGGMLTMLWATQEYAGLASRHDELDQLLNLYVLPNQGGDGLDFLITQERNALAERMNTANEIETIARAVVFATYLWNAGDVLFVRPARSSAWRFQLTPGYTSLAFEVRF